ncbi:MAG: hypothetical protein QNJ27_03665, partial [Simkaniaceae bacterium]|nr:hypothetical protein [Simkaniaceae bacterium]
MMFEKFFPFLKSFSGTATRLTLVRCAILLLLGGCYKNEKGASQDDNKALYCTLAAEQGDAEAQFALGCCYYNGTGVPQD